MNVLLNRNPMLWIRVLLILAMLVISVIITNSRLQIFFIPLAILFPALLMILAILRWPGIGIVAIIVASLIVPFSINTGTRTTINITILLIVGLVGLWMLAGYQKKEWKLPLSRPIPPLLLLIVAASLSFVIGSQPWILFTQTAPIASQLGGLAIFLLSAGAFFLVAVNIPNLRWLELMTWTFVALGGIFIIGRLTTTSSILGLFQRRSTGSMFWTWLIAISLSQALFNSKLPRGWRVVLGLITVATFYVAYYQSGGWRSGWVPPLICVAVLLGFRFGRLVFSGSLIGLLLIPGFLASLISADQYSYSTRLEAWGILGEIIKANPLTGLGPANYYWYTPLYSISGYFVQFNSHNQYVDLVAQTGILGLAAFMWFAWELVRLGWRLLSQTPEGFARAYVYGALAGLAGTLFAGFLGDWVLPFVYNVGLKGLRASVLAWLFLGGLIVVERVTKASANPRSI